jgi:hypothetical protein
MISKWKYSTLAGPCLVIFMGALLILTRRYSVSIVGPVEEGGLVVFVGVLLCALGLWALIQTLRSNRIK